MSKTKSEFLEKRIALSQQIGASCHAGRYNECGFRYEGEFTDFFVDEIKHAKIYVDCGGELGFYSYIAAALMTPDAQIHIFEPEPSNFEVLKVSFCSDDRIHLYNNAVSFGGGEVTLASVADEENPISYSMDTSLSMLKGLGKYHQEREVRLTVPAIALDEIFTSQTVDVIKMDIEGGEVFAFEGMQKLLARQRTVIFLEMHYDYICAIRSDGVEFINSILKESKYSFYDVDAHKNVEKIVAGRYILRPPTLLGI